MNNIIKSIEKYKIIIFSSVNDKNKDINRSWSHNFRSYRIVADANLIIGFNDKFKNDFIINNFVVYKHRWIWSYDCSNLSLINDNNTFFIVSKDFSNELLTADDTYYILHLKSNDEGLAKYCEFKLGLRSEDFLYQR